jgi:hypothetical protein
MGIDWVCRFPTGRSLVIRLYARYERENVRRGTSRKDEGWKDRKSSLGRASRAGVDHRELW